MKNPKRIKPLFVATQDSGGAAVATLRLMDALSNQGIHTNMLTYYKQTRRSDVIGALDQISGIQNLGFRSTMRYNRYQSNQYWEQHNGLMWSSNRIANPIHQLLNSNDSNIVHLHWIGTGFVPLASIPKISKPIVWTLHDMWAFTGGCHVTAACRRYESHCGQCPLLNSDTERDLSYDVFERKAKHWQGIPLTLIAPSQWLADCAKASTLLQDKIIEVIPNPIDTTQFQPLNQTFARQALHLPLDKKLLLFGAGFIHDRNKNLPKLLEALQHMPDKSDIELVIFGDGQLDPTQASVPVHHIGHISDLRLLNLLYNAADVTIIPSQQEAFGQVAVESLACGTPAVAFATSGLLDVVNHKENGYLAVPYDSSDLANGIQWILSEADTAALAHHAREKVLTHFSMDVVAKQHITVYERVLEESHP